MLNFIGICRKMKGYKITDSKRKKKYGIAANSLKMLKEKSCAKFNLEECRVYSAKDGSEIVDEDYFATVEAQTLLVVADPSEIVKTDFELIYEAIRGRNNGIFEVASLIRNFVNENRTEIERMLLEIDNRASFDKNKVNISSRTDHIEWFQGQDQRYNTKEEVMRRKAQDRIRGYFYKAKEEITCNDLYRNNPRAKAKLDRVLNIFQYLLISCDYFYMIFDRHFQRKHPLLLDNTDAAFNPPKKVRKILKEYVNHQKLLDEWSVSLCTDRGEFYCQGLWNEETCGKVDHVINPYLSREMLILFQVWNLDHQIELTRNVIPSLIQNVQLLVNDDSPFCAEHGNAAIDISIFRYFLEMFSLANLKLVHIVCHDKTRHEQKSQGRLICAKCAEYDLINDFIKNVLGDKN